MEQQIPDSWSPHQVYADTNLNFVAERLSVGDGSWQVACHIHAPLQWEFNALKMAVGACFAWMEKSFGVAPNPSFVVDSKGYVTEVRFWCLPKATVGECKDIAAILLDRHEIFVSFVEVVGINAFRARETLLNPLLTELLNNDRFSALRDSVTEIVMELTEMLMEGR